TERMLAAAGAAVERRSGEVTVQAPERLEAGEIHVPGDLSSAAFFAVAAVLVPGSEVVLRGVGVNPTRTGLLDVLARMGVSARTGEERVSGGEPVADLTVAHGQLRAATVRAA